MRTTRFSSASWRVAGSFALGLGLLMLGALGLLTLALALPTRAAAHGHDHEVGDSPWSDSGRRSGKSFHWTGRVSRGKTVEVSGINGGIQVELTSGSQVIVDARKTGQKSDPESVQIEANENDGNVTVCARYPRPDGSLNDCAGDKQETRNNDVTVSFRVKIPAGVNLVVHTVNGAIEAEGLRGDVEAATVNGSVKVSTSGLASAHTVNGSVLARLGRLDEDLDFVTVNGQVRVELPRNVDAAVHARTMHGSISTDFPLSVHGRWGKRMTGSIGRGGPQVRLETVNGSIILLSAGGRIRDDRGFSFDDDDADNDDDDDGEDDYDDEEDEDDDPR